MAPRRSEPVWINRLVLDAVHLDTTRTHGGLPGLRDANALEAAVARPRHRWAYARRRDPASLAAAYGFELARDHPYRDGNKRVAFLAMLIFLGLNGCDLEVGEDDVVKVMLGLAAGRMSEGALANWARLHLVPYRGH